ncbi:MAG TPA: DUF3108 domain-containing protein [Sulfuriferula sp.]|nr:DUF3108 domain-containing protein [Sulfuriferula sp.]
MMTRYAALLLALIAVPALAAPRQVEIDYNLSHNGLEVGTVHETYTRRGNSYRIDSQTRAAGPLAVLFKGELESISEGKITAHGLRPTKFEQTRSDAPQKNISSSFDWKTKQVTHTSKDRSEAVALPADAQDRLSVLYQFMFVRPGAKKLDFDVSTGHSLSHEVYTLVGEETLATPVGALKTLHYRNQPEKGEKQIEVWLARDKRYLPAQVRIVDDGATALQTLSQIKIE